MNTRRKLIAGLAAGGILFPVRAVAQTTTRVFRVAYLSPGASNSPAAIYFDVLKNRLRELGHAEGTAVVFDSRWAESNTSRLPALAAELAALKPDVMVATATLAIRAAQQATASIPIVMAPGTDPVGSGFVKSLARPGGNITGVANLSIDTSAKIVELLHALVPKARRFGILTMPRNPTHATHLEAAMTAIKAFGLTGIPARAASGDEIDAALLTLAKEKCEALVVFNEPLFSVERQRLANLAAKYRLPAIYQSSGNVDAGGLISYGANVDEMFRMAATYVDKLLRGAKPENLPVEQPTRLELVVNAKVAQALGLKIPQSILLQATRTIE